MNPYKNLLREDLTDATADRDSRQSLKFDDDSSWLNTDPLPPRNGGCRT